MTETKGHSLHYFRTHEGKKKKKMICGAECLVLYGDEIMLQGHGSAEGKELPGCQPQSSQVRRDDELMQSLSSMSSASDPPPILPLTLVTLPISPLRCLILLTQSYLFLLPFFSPPCLFQSLSYPPPPISFVSLSPPFALYCGCQEMRKALNYCAHGIINVKVVVCSAGQEATANRQRGWSNKSCAVRPTQTDI